MARLGQGSSTKLFPPYTLGQERERFMDFLNSGQGGGSEADEARPGKEGRGGRPRTQMQAPREGSWNLSTRRKRGGPRMGQITFQ